MESRAARLGEAKGDHLLTRSIALTLLVLCACTPARETARPPIDTAVTNTGVTATGETAAPEANVREEPAATPTPAPAVREQNIYVDSVEAANPVVITGRARTFENHVSLRVRGADGKVIAEGFTISTGEMGQHNPYRGTLWLTRDPGRRIIAEALEYSAKDGAEINVSRVQKAFDVTPVEITLYFPDRNCNAVKPYGRRVPKTVSIARLLVEALVAGPLDPERKAGASSPFPAGSRLESVILREGTLTVDFNERLRNVGGSCAAQMIRASVERTLRQLPSVRKVIITAGGSEPLALQP